MSNIVILSKGYSCKACSFYDALDELGWFRFRSVAIDLFKSMASYNAICPEIHLDKSDMLTMHWSQDHATVTINIHPIRGTVIYSTSNWGKFTPRKEISFDQAMFSTELWAIQLNQEFNRTQEKLQWSVESK